MSNLYFDLESIISIGNVDTLINLVGKHGNLRQAETNNLYGFNIFGADGFTTSTKISQGYVFFTRPQLNMGNYNLSTDTRLRPLLTTNEKSINRYIRCMLDPARSKHFKTTSPLVNERNAFIPLLSNNLKTLSGFPDFVVNKEVTEEGLRGEQISIPDGYANIYKEYDVNCTFKIAGELGIVRLFLVWMIYEVLVREGVCTPYTVFSVEREIDYNTRIYRILLDKSRRYVVGIGCTGASYPYAINLGNLMDYNKDQVYKEGTDEISVSFSSMGFLFMDPLIIREFNMTQCMFEPEVAKVLTGEDSQLVEVPSGEDGYAFNYNAIPIINEDTNEFKWYIRKDSKVYTHMLKYYKEEEKED